ncbi:MAG: MraY family glycosyltransferase [Dehalococcoidia bacterium]|nr:MraY family glycosyltransferase [Dehalococcoidia bacterium]
MTTYLLIFAAALVITAIATPIARRVAPSVGMLDQPEARKMHAAPVPLLGGVCMYAAFLVALLVFSDRLNLPEFFGILIGATAVSVLGVWDDRRRLRPMVKLGGQVLAAIFLASSGTQVLLFSDPLLNYAITVIWVVAITNSLNLLDNMDGLSGGVAAVASSFFLVLALLNGQYLVASLSAALLGACLGFLRYNFNPASIFMGDGGSLFIGFILAAVGVRLRFPDHATVVTWMVPVFVLGVPMFDTLLVVVSRLRRGLNPLTTPGKDHLSHRLVALGLSQRQSVLLIYAICCVLGLTAAAIPFSGPIIAYGAIGVAIVLSTAAIIRLEKVNYGQLSPPLDC